MPNKVKIEIEDRAALQWLTMIHTMRRALPFSDEYDAVILEIEDTLKREILKQVTTQRLLRIGRFPGPQET